jgi:hypothetical protein
MFQEFGRIKNSLASEDCRGERGARETAQRGGELGPSEAACEVLGDIAINNAKGALFGYNWQFSPNWLTGIGKRVVFKDRPSVVRRTAARKKPTLCHRSRSQLPVRFGAADLIGNDSEAKPGLLSQTVPRTRTTGRGSWAGSVTR